MARPACGAEALDMVQDIILHARTIDGLGQQAGAGSGFAAGLESELRTLENDMPRVQSIVAWDWIVNARLK